MNVYPLSNAQKRIWLTQKKYEHSSLFNIGGMVKINGEVDAVFLKKAITNTILKNPALRIQLREKNKVIGQYISQQAIQVGFVDFSNDEDAFWQWYARQAQTPFQMLACPLYYFSVFKLPAHKSGYFIKLHHIIADGWSIQLLTDQITKEYEAMAKSEGGEHEGEAFLSEEQPSYIDFVLQEEAQLKKSAKAKKYWNKMYEQLPQQNAAYDTNLNGQRMSFIPEEGLQERIEEYIKKYKISLNTFFIFIYILHQYKRTGNRDIIVGTPLLGRRGRVERQTFGTFTNTMPYRYILAEQRKLSEVVKEIAADLNSNLRYQSYPYNLLHQDLGLSQRGRGSLYHSCVNYYNTNIKTVFAGFQAENIEYYNGQQAYELQIIVRHWNNVKLQLDFDFLTALYSEQQIKEMYRQWTILMNQLFEDDNKRAADLVLIDQEEQVKYLAALPKTAKVYPKHQTWLDLFAIIVHHKPDNIAVSKGNQSMTYQELDRWSNQLANYLVAVGLHRGALIAVIPEYDLLSIAVIVAIMKSGGIYLPMDVNAPMGRINEILHHSEADFFIAKRNNSNFQGRFLSYQELEAGAFHREAVNCSAAGDTVYIIYTSGSTGRPKGVMITHRNFMNYLCWAKEQYLQSDQEVFALYSSFAFDFTMTSIFLPLISGNEVRIYHPIKEDNVFNEIAAENRVTILKITPSLLALFLAVKGKVSKLHTFIIGGESLKTKVCEQLSAQFEHQIIIYNEYGPTEATIGCMIYRYDQDKSATVPIGRPIANTTILLLDQDRKPVPDNMLGEIYIGGDSVSKGYYRLIEETSKRFIENPYQKEELLYQTGDGAYRDAAGDIIFCKRLDHEVKIRGNRVHLSEVEHRILASNMVKDVFVKALQNKNEISQLCAYLIPKETFDQGRLKSYLKEYLPDYMMPYHYMHLDYFPLTDNGKIDEEKLQSPFCSRIKQHQKRGQPKQEALLQAVRELIGEEATLADSFYSMGGDSIKAIQLSSRLSEQGYELTVQDILSHQVFGDMAERIRRRAKIEYSHTACSGELQKTPILRWFFEQNFVEKGHYNQSVLLELGQVTAVEALDQVFSKLVEYHDILRLNYDQQRERLFYNNEHLNSVGLVQVIKAAQFGKHQIREVIRTRIVHNFDLKKDLLFKPYLLVLADSSYLYLMAHHLIIDGVSWRILLADMLTLLQQLDHGRRLLLPEPTISFGQYANEYHSFAARKSISTDEWNALLNTKNPLLCQDEPAVYAQTKKIHLLLDQVETRQLLGAANEPYHTKANELLLIALAQAVNQVFAVHELVLKLEGHGRDLLENVNTNRTVGWFTNMFPIRLKIPPAGCQEQMKSLKEQIRAGTRRGYEYGILNGLQKRNVAEPRMIYFNYLGEFQEEKNDYFTLSEFLPDFNIAEKNQIPYLLEVNAVVLDKRCHILLQYDEKKFAGDQIDIFAHSFALAVKRLLAHCVGLAERFFTPADFDGVDLTQEELDYLFLPGRGGGTGNEND